MNHVFKFYGISANVKWTSYLGKQKFFCSVPFNKILRLYSENHGKINEADLVTCDFSHDNKIALVTFNAPTKLNALSVPMGGAFKSKIDDLSTRNDLRAVILTGRGNSCLYC